MVSKTCLSVVLDFMNQTITYMDTLSWIERYSWFGYFVSCLTTDTELSTHILNPAQRPRPDVHYSKPLFNLMRAKSYCLTRHANG